MSYSIKMTLAAHDRRPFIYPSVSVCLLYLLRLLTTFCTHTSGAKNKVFPIMFHECKLQCLVKFPSINLISTWYLIPYVLCHSQYRIWFDTNFGNSCMSVKTLLCILSHIFSSVSLFAQHEYEFGWKLRLSLEDGAVSCNPVTGVGM